MDNKEKSPCSDGCVTGYWTDGYETSICHGDDITDYKESPETTVFNFCPICGKQLQKSQDNHVQ